MTSGYYKYDVRILLVYHSLEVAEIRNFNSGWFIYNISRLTLHNAEDYAPDQETPEVVKSQCNLYQCPYALCIQVLKAINIWWPKIFSSRLINVHKINFIIIYLKWLCNSSWFSYTNIVLHHVTWCHVISYGYCTRVFSVLTGVLTLPINATYS